MGVLSIVAGGACVAQRREVVTLGGLNCHVVPSVTLDARTLPWTGRMLFILWGGISVNMYCCRDRAVIVFARTGAIAPSR